MKDSQFILRRDGQQDGPYGWAELQSFAATGELCASDELKEVTSKHWKHASEIADLFVSDAVTSTPSLRPPHAGGTELEVGTDEVWWYQDDGTQKGPASTKGLCQMVRSGSLSSRTLVWKKGLADWLPVD